MFLLIVIIEIFLTPGPHSLCALATDGGRSFKIKLPPVWLNLADDAVFNGPIGAERDVCAPSRDLELNEVEYN